MYQNRKAIELKSNFTEKNDQWHPFASLKGFSFQTNNRINVI